MAIHTSSDIIAQRYVVSSSVSHYTSSAASGSHIFGDSPDDKHRFTGSLEFGTGSAFFKSNVTASGNVTFTGANKKISGSSTSTGSFGRIYVDGADGAVNIDTNIQVPGGAVANPSYAFTNDTSTGMSRPTSNAINFVTAGSERVRVDGSGNVLIGHTAAIAAINTLNFQINNASSNNNGVQINSWGTNGAHQGFLYFNHSKSGTAGSHTALASTDAIGAIYWQGSDGTDFANSSARIAVTVDGSVSSNRVPGRITFETAEGVADNDILPKMTIRADGKVGIGTTSPDGDLDIRGPVGYVYHTSDLASGTNNLIFRSGSVAETWTGQIEFVKPAGTSQIVTRNTSNLKLGTNNTGAITISGSNQYVGIGETSPDTLLHLKASAPALRLEGTGTSGRDYDIKTDGNEIYIEGVGGSSGALKVGENGAYPMEVDLGGLHVQFPTANIKVSGSSTSTGSFGHGFIDSKLGIGTTSPTTPLEIKSSTSGELAAIKLHNTSTSADDNVAIHFRAANLGAAKIVADAPGASDTNFEFHTVNAGGAGAVFTMKGDNVLSGSSTSTGSFGSVKTTGNLFIGGYHGLQSNSNGWLYITNNTGATYQANISRMAGTEFYAATLMHTPILRPVAGASGDITLEANSTTFAGSIISTKADGVISGSSTSTGSFGMVLTGAPTAGLLLGSTSNGHALIQSRTIGDYIQYNANGGHYFTTNGLNYNYIGSDNNFYNATNIIQTTTNGLISGSSTSTGSFGQIALSNNPVSTGYANPTLNFGDGDTGFYENSDDQLYLSIGGSTKWKIFSDTIGASLTAGPAILNETPSSTNPTLVPNRGDGDTGIGGNGGNELYLITAGGAKATFANSNNYAIDVNTGADNGLIVKQSSTTLHQTSAEYIQFPKANFKISGSSTSTGSFGKFIIGTSTGLSGADHGDLFVKNQSGATATFVGDGAADTSIIRLGTSWGRHWTFMASPYDTYAPGNAYDLEIGYTMENRGDHNELSGSIVFNNYKNVAFMGSGSIGIGTRTPDAELQIMNNNGSSYRFGYGGTSDVYLDADNVYIRTDNGGANTATFTTTGLGIGETDPDELLHMKSSTDAKPVIKLENSGNNSNSPQLVFLNSGTADDNDITGTIRFKLMNDAGTPEETEYGTIYGRATDVSNGSEDSELHFRTINGGSLNTTMIAKSGKVGIGHTFTSPETALHVYGSNSTAGDLYTAVGSGNVPSITIQNASATSNNNAGLFFRDNDAMAASVHARFTNHSVMASQLRFSTAVGGNTREKVVITESGSLGIGTMSPSEALEINKSGANLKVVSDDNVYLSLDTTQTNGDEWHIFNANSGATSTLQFKNIDQSAVVMLMDETGKVGIGTTSPVNSLHVLSSALIENDTDSNGAEAALYFKVDSQDTAARRKGAIIFQRTGTAGIGDMYFCADGTSDGGDATSAADAKMVIKGAGNVLFPTANSKISGSSTSTGSFGTVYASGKMRIGRGFDGLRGNQDLRPFHDLYVSSSYNTTQNSAEYTAVIENQKAEAKLHIVGRNDETAGAYGDSRAGASISLRNLDATSGSYSSINWYNATGYGVGGIDMKNISHGVTGHTESEMRFYTRNKASNYHIAMTLDKNSGLAVEGALSKGSGTFRIPHPVPEKKDKLYLQHSFVESPTRGDNIYRWQIEVKDNQYVIELPDYYQHLNENDMVWVNPVNHFGRGYGNVNEEQTELTINTDADGLYNVLLIGTRKDETAVNNFKGIEIERENDSEEIPEEDIYIK